MRPATPLSDEMHAENTGMPRTGLLFLIFDIGNGIANRGDFFGIFVGDFEFERFFERHDEFDDVERVGPKVIDERRFVIHLALVHAELLYDDLLDFLFNS